MKLYLTQRPSALTPALVSVPAAVVARVAVAGLPAVNSACGWRAEQEQSVQSIRTRVAGSRFALLTQATAPDHGTSGLVTQASGMVKAARKGGKASGIPPRTERQA